MDDYIKRSDAVHALCKAVHKDDGEIPCENQTTSCLWSKTRVCDYAREIDAVPSADIPHWIPCSERMPETSDEVLTTCIVNGNTKKTYVETATWWADNSDEGGCWTSVYNEYRTLGARIERIAWMPLPEPYKKDGEQE